MKKIDSQALEIVNKALGLTGAGSPSTELTDGVVDQVLEVGQIARRSRTLGESQGIYTAALLNEHGAGNTLTTSVLPYAIGATALLPGTYPNPMPASLDIWLLDATVTRSAGTGTLAASLQLLYPTSRQAFGMDDGGGAAGLLTNISALCIWDALESIGFTFGTLKDSGYPGMHDSLRLARGAELRFVSTSSAVADFICWLTLGVFPVALGQDGVV